MQLSMRDLTRLFGVTEQTVYRWVNEQALPAQQINGQLRFNRAVLLEWATLAKIQLPARFLQATANNGQTPSLPAALEAGGVQSGVAGISRPDVLAAVIGAMPLPEGCDRDLLLQVLISRDTTGVSDLGDGLAVPHARFPIVLPLARPQLTIAYLLQPVPFSANPAGVHTLFLLVCPTTHEHLALLARLAYALRDKEFHRLIKSKAALEALLGRARAIEEDLKPAGAPGAPGAEVP